MKSEVLARGAALEMHALEITCKHLSGKPVWYVFDVVLGEAVSSGLRDGIAARRERIRIAFERAQSRPRWLPAPRP